MFKSFNFLLLALILFAGCNEKEKEEVKTVAKAKTSISFNFTYQVSLPELKENFSKIELVIPVPQDNDYQKIENLTIETNGTYESGDEYHFGNKYLLFSFPDTLFGPPQASFTVDVTRMENRNLTTKKYIEAEDAQVFADFLLPDSLVPIDGQIAVEAARIVNNDMTDLEKARAIYDHLFETMSYDKSGEGWGRGDAVYACDIRKGNCTDFHSLFIGMMRSQGIPARFLIGFSIPTDTDEGTIGGYHCWAEFYIDGRGWIAVDISEAAKDPSRKDFLFGRLDKDRVTFTTGRDLQLDTYTDVKTLNFFIYPQVYVDGEEYTGYTKAFSFRKN